MPALRDLGAAVVVPNYALAPKVGIPDITLQMVRAVAWSWRHARTLGGDARRIVVMGHSAGAAHVAHYVAHPRFHVQPGGGIAGAMIVSGLFVALSDDLAAIPPRADSAPSANRREAGAP